jgi:UDP-3-O-[3-hydroxymyristoyl] glucosamine N-acyltransferase
MANPLSIQDIATLINARIVGDHTVTINNVAPLHCAKPGELSFVSNAANASKLSNTNASAVIVTDEFSAQSPCATLIVTHPEYAFAKVAALFDPFIRKPAGIHPTALIDATASIAPSATIGPFCVIGKHVTIGEHAYLSSHVTIGDNATIGNDAFLHDKVSILHGCHIGSRVTLHAGVVIGADGFGLTRTPQGWHKMPQIGGVLIEDDVEIGANTCVDRGALKNTLIHRGVKIDNLVQIAHNVEIGEHTVIAGCTGIAGSTTIGKYCMIAGAANIGGHLTICDHTVITGNAMVTKSIDTPGVYSSGTGLLTNSKWRKMAVRLRQLDDFMKKRD